MNVITMVGLVAATCTTIAFLPQAAKTIRSKQTKDLSLGMYSIFTTGVLLWVVYGFLIGDLPVVLANGITLFLSASILYIMVKYR